MGWGVFILSRALRKRPESEPVFIPAVSFLAVKFFESYRNRILTKSVLLSPMVRNKVDMSEWEDDIHSRAKKDWFTLLVALVIVNLFWILAGVFFGFLFSPLIWYYGKKRLIQKAIKDIDKEFEQNDFDVKKLKADALDSLKSEVSQNLKIEKILQEKDQATRIARKFGKSSEN